MHGRAALIALRLLASFFLLVTACAGAPPAGSTGCRVDSDCALVERSCCAPCAEYTPEMYEAVAAPRTGARRHELCPEPMGCPECESPPPDPAIVAACIGGQCAVVRR